MILTTIVDTAELVDKATKQSLLQNAGLAAIFIGIAVFLILYALFAPKNLNRVYRVAPTPEGQEVELSGFDRYIRPMLRNFIPQSPLAAQMENKKLDSTRELLIKSGNPWNIRAEEFLGIQVLFGALGLIGGVILFVFPVVPVVPPVIWILLLPLGTFVIPYSFHNSLRIKRGEEMQKQLPEAIDLLVITLGSGKTFEPALSQIVPSLPDGLLKEEFTKLNFELEAGTELAKGLLDFAHRSSSEDAETFAKAVVQAQKLGTEPSETLQNQATAAREAYEARVEKKIARLSSIMMIPLVFTMIPALILIILAPTMMNLSTSMG